MKKFMILILAITILMIGCTSEEKTISADETADSALYRLNQVIVVFKRTPTQEARERIKRSFADRNINIDNLEVKKCHNCQQCKGCDSYVELWEADNIHTQIHAEGSNGGTVTPRGSDGVGEDDLAYYSLNFLNDIPQDTVDFKNFHYQIQKPASFSGERKDTIRVAVLDTGIDTTRIVSPSLLWRNKREKSNTRDDDNNCYPDDTGGWNFVDNTPKTADDNLNLHGTLVSHFIINEFLDANKNFVQIMNLKTHDAKGRGDLFSSICAMHYAIEKRANIINASWGFYYYESRVHPYLDHLITNTMRSRGILFVTAAGNQIDIADEHAEALRSEEDDGDERPENWLRNLEYHHFYPACLSKKGENVITVTTTDGTSVSPTQNHSEQYVDIGVLADRSDTNGMHFKTPFAGPTPYVRGSSFATAIASGKIGAYLSKANYSRDLDKNTVFAKVKDATPAGKAVLITLEPVMAETFIRKGRKTYPR